MNIVSPFTEKRVELAKTASDNPLPVLCNLRYFKKKLKWSRCLSHFHLIFLNCLERLQTKINFFKLCKKTPRSINSAKIFLSQLTERSLTNGTRVRVYLWRNLHQMSPKLQLIDGAIVWQHFPKFTWRLSYVLETGQILANGSYGNGS